MSKALLSFEYFPPHTPQGVERLCATHRSLATLQPAFCSVTYGAGGSTRERTREIVLRLLELAEVEVAPHLSFGGDSEATIAALLDEYRDRGIRHLVALRGDSPSGIGGPRLLPASELVAFIRRHSGEHFQVDVACYPEMHPQAVDFTSDVRFLKRKLDAGANSAITQYFFNSDAFFHFRDQCHRAGIDKPIYPGIMPIGNYRNLARFSKNCGAEIPRWLHHRVEALGEDSEAIIEFGIEVVSRLCETLLAGGVPGLHFYTMNQAGTTTRICRNIGLA